MVLRVSPRRPSRRSNGSSTPAEEWSRHGVPGAGPRGRRDPPSVFRHVLGRERQQPEAVHAAEEARKEVESELAAARERLAGIKAENDAVPETHDWNEAKTRALLIDVALQRAGWPLDQPRDKEYEA